MHAAGAHGGNGPWEDDLRDIDGAYLNNRGEFVVAVDGERIVGMGALRSMSETMGEIKRMRVHPDFQRRGIGQRIYDILEARARELGYTALWLDTTENLHGAIRLYTKNGFREVERKPWRQLEMLFFEKRLS
jgi:ribosomal protein S18 acetylase RimI-like enzyme